MNLVLDYESTALAAPQSFRDAMQSAANILDSTIKDNITVTIQVGYGDWDNGLITNLGSSAVGADMYGSYVSYTSLRAALASHETSTLDQTFVNSLPNSTSVNGVSSLYVPSAVEKALGMISPTASAIDGAVGIGAGIPTSDLVGVALHEFTHALGREPGAGTFDLTRYTSAGNHLFSSGSTAPAAYFSIDGGVTKLADYGQNSDPADFLNGGVQDVALGGGKTDPLDEFYSGATVQQLSTVDKELLDALGFNVGTTAPSGPSATTSSLVASSSTVKADGTSTTTLTVTVKDASGAAVANTAVTLSASGSSNSFGTISGTTDANGVFKTTLASTLAQNETITATEGGVQEQTSVSFVAGAPSATTSSLVANAPTVTADGTTTTTLTVTVEDANGNAVAGTAVTLSGSGSANSFGAISGTTNANGVFTTTLASTLVQNETITATEGSVQEHASVSFVAGAASAATSSLVASSPTVAADGTSTTALTVTVEDALGHAVAGTAVTLSGSGSSNSFGAISGITNANGVFSTTLASTLVQNETITATEGSTREHTSVSFVPPAIMPTLSVSNDPTAAHGQIVSLSNLVTISDPSGVGYQKLELWDSNGTAAGGQFVINGVAQTGGHEIDVTSANVANTVFNPGTSGGTDTLWAQLQLNDGTLDGWQQFSVTVPVPTLSVAHNHNTATTSQAINLSSLVTISDPGHVGYQKLELWDSNGTVAGGEFVVNGVVQTGGHEIDVTPANVANTVFDPSTSGGSDTLWAQLQLNDGTLSGWQQFSVTVPKPTLSVQSDPAATGGQQIALSSLVGIADPGHVGYQKLELWDSNGTAPGGEFVVNGVAQTGGHEIDVTPANVANTVFDAGTSGGSDTLWAQLQLNDGTLSGWQQFSVTVAKPTLSVQSDPAATGGQQIALSSLVGIADPGHVGYQKLELWDSNGTAPGGEFVVNGVAQTGGHEIDVTLANVANTVFDAGTSGGSDMLWAQLQLNDGTLSGWQQFSVTVPKPTLSVQSDPAATGGQQIALSSLVSIADPGHVGYQKLELWDSNGTAAGGEFVVNGVAQTGGHEIDVTPANVANTVFDAGTSGGSDTLWAQLQLNDGTLTGWQKFTVNGPAAVQAKTAPSPTGQLSGDSFHFGVFDRGVTSPTNPTQGPASSGFLESVREANLVSLFSDSHVEHPIFPATTLDALDALDAHGANMPLLMHMSSFILH